METVLSITPENTLTIGAMITVLILAIIGIHMLWSRYRTDA